MITNLRGGKPWDGHADHMEPFDPQETIKELRKRGLNGAADHMEYLFGAWLRTLEAYVVAIPFMEEKPREQQLHVVNATAFRIWGPKIIGTPARDDAKVLGEHEADRAYHKYGPEAREGGSWDIGDGR